MMDAAFDNPFDDFRFYQRTGTRQASMEEPIPSRTLTEAEFSAAVSEGLPQLVAVARRLTGDEDLAGEAVQNALLKAAKSWRRFRGHAEVKTWLTRIVIHCVRDAITAQRKRSSRTTLVAFGESEQHTHGPIDPSQGPTQEMIGRETQDMIGRAVRGLPDRQREVFGLMVWQNMSAREVGSLLNIDHQTVHANLHAARKKLREVLRPMIDQDESQ